MARISTKELAKVKRDIDRCKEGDDGVARSMTLQLKDALDGSSGAVMVYGERLVQGKEAFVLDIYANSEHHEAGIRIWLERGQAHRLKNFLVRALESGTA